MLDIKLLDIIACPICKGRLGYNKKTNELICKFDKLAFPIVDNIPALLVEKARKLKMDEI